MRQKKIKKNFLGPKKRLVSRRRRKGRRSCDVNVVEVKQTTCDF